MKKLLHFILAMALISLACLDVSGAVVSSVQPSQVATRFEIPATVAAATVTPARTLTPSAQLCARVDALKVQNLRKLGSTSSWGIGYLHNGDVVQVIDKIDPDWWQVKRGEDIGFARSIYLKDVECEVSHE